MNKWKSNGDKTALCGNPVNLPIMLLSNFDNEIIHNFLNFITYTKFDNRLRRKVELSNCL